MRSDLTSNRSWRQRATAVISILWFGASIGMGAAAAMRLRAGELATGAAIAAAALILVYFTAHYLGNILPGMLGLAAINSFAMLISGHRINRADLPAPRLESGIEAVLFLGAAVLSKRLIKSKITTVGRFAVLGAMTSLLIGITNDSYALPAVAAMLCFVGAAGVIQSHPSGRHPSSDRETEGGVHNPDKLNANP